MRNQNTGHPNTHGGEGVLGIPVSVLFEDRDLSPNAAQALFESFRREDEEEVVRTFRELMSEEGADVEVNTIDECREIDADLVDDIITCRRELVEQMCQEDSLPPAPSPEDAETRWQELVQNMGDVQRQIEDLEDDMAICDPDGCLVETCPFTDEGRELPPSERADAIASCPLTPYETVVGSTGMDGMSAALRDSGFRVHEIGPSADGSDVQTACDLARARLDKLVASALYGRVPLDATDESGFAEGGALAYALPTAYDSAESGQRGAATAPTGQGDGELDRILAEMRKLTGLVLIALRLIEKNMA